MLATGETVGLTEWIIDDTCLVLNCFFLLISPVRLSGSLLYPENTHKTYLNFFKPSNSGFLMDYVSRS